MSSTLKYILWILIAAIGLVLLGYLLTNRTTVVQTSKTIKTETKTSVHVDENTFTVEQVANIKKALTDSLKDVYGSIINQLKAVHISDNDTSVQINTDRPIYAYVSEIDSNITAKDSLGNVTDKMNVKSTFISPEPLAENCLHLLKIDHQSYSKSILTNTIEIDTIVVKESSSFIDFSLKPNLSAGYGLIHKQFDFYAGIGINIEFDPRKIF